LGNETITKSRLSVTMCENAHRYFVLSVCVWRDWMFELRNTLRRSVCTHDLSKLIPLREGKLPGLDEDNSR
jgi:hypothetical protein